MTSTIPLGELIAIRGGGTPSRSTPAYWNGDIRWATVKDFKSTELTETEERITSEGLRSSATNIIPAGSVIVPTRMAVGKAAINTIDLAINQDLKALIPKREVYARFLLHFLLAQGAYLESQAQGATVKGIKLDLLRSLPFPNIPLSEQRRIATILDKAEAVRRKREHALALADEFLKSSFLEMFGDPTKLQDEGAKLSDVAIISRGRFSPRPRNDPRYYNGDFPFIQTGEISSSDGYITGYRQALNEAGIKVSKSFPIGTVFIAIVGATIGATAVSARQFWCPDSVIGIVPKSKDVPGEFIEFLLRFWRPVFIETAPSTARANINLQTLDVVRIPKVGTDEPARFAAMFKRVYQLKKKFAHLESGLLPSLSQRAFCGEL